MSIHAHRRSRDGRVVYEVRLRDAEGREYSRRFDTKKAAEAFQNQQRADRSRGTWIDPRKADVTFVEVAQAWLAANPVKRPSGLSRDESIVRIHLLPALGDRALGSITPRDVHTLVRAWFDRQAPRTVRRQYGVLRAILNYAVDSELLGRSPARSVRMPAIGERAARRVLTSHELAALADAVGERFGPMVFVGAVLGLRWGECAGLRVGRLDFLARTITVAEQRTRGTGGRMVEGAPKSAAGRRTMSVPGPLMDLLAAHLARRHLSAADADAYVFVGPEGGPLEYSGFRQRVWGPACKAVELEGFGFHDLRRCNATYLVQSGVDIKTAQSRLGHSDPRLTLAVYAQVTTVADRAAADRLGRELMAPQEQSAATGRARREVEGA